MEYVLEYETLESYFVSICFLSQHDLQMYLHLRAYIYDNGHIYALCLIIAKTKQTHS